MMANIDIVIPTIASSLDFSDIYDVDIDQILDHFETLVHNRFTYYTQSLCNTMSTVIVSVPYILPFNIRADLMNEKGFYVTLTTG